MRPILRIGTLLIVFLVTLAACTAPPSIASAPMATPASTPRQQSAEAVPRDGVVLASGHYQLLMLYSPL